MSWTASPWKGGKTRFRWSFMERYTIPFRAQPDVLYLNRLRVVQTPWLGVMLHEFHNPDIPIFHDHPWNFISIVLKGKGYTERRPHGKTKRVRWFNFVRATDAHYIESLASDRVWTLVLVGRRQRNWGYLEPTDSGFQWSAWDLHEFEENA